MCLPLDLLASSVFQSGSLRRDERRRTAPAAADRVREREGASGERLSDRGRHTHRREGPLADGKQAQRRQTVHLPFDDEPLSTRKLEGRYAPASLDAAEN